MSDEDSAKNPCFLDDEQIERKRIRLEGSGKKPWILTDRQNDRRVMEEMGVEILSQDDTENFDVASCSFSNMGRSILQAVKTNSELKRKRNIENVRPSSCQGSIKSPENSSRTRNSESVLCEKDINEVHEQTDEETPVPQLPADNLHTKHSTFALPNLRSPNEGTGSKEKSTASVQLKSPNDQGPSSPVLKAGSASPSAMPDGAKTDVFADVSDEVILQIFKWLPKRHLVKCALVCRRWHSIASDESLWQRLELGGRLISKGALGRIMAKKPIVLRLASAEVGPWTPTSITQYRLQYLDLSMSTMETATLNGLLEQCPALRRVSLESGRLDVNTAILIGKCPRLETLNLTMASGLEEKGLTAILTGCTQLESLNISWCKLSSEAAEVVCDKSPVGLQRLNLAGTRLLTDLCVERLVKRCPSLQELDVSDCCKLTEASLASVSKLQSLRHLAISRCYLLAPLNYLMIHNMPSLQYLDVWGMIPGSQLATLRQRSSHISVNQFMLSAIARPTVGPRRTSIWGIRTRD